MPLVDATPMDNDILTRFWRLYGVRALWRAYRRYARADDNDVVMVMLFKSDGFALFECC